MFKQDLEKIDTEIEKHRSKISELERRRHVLYMSYFDEKFQGKRLEEANDRKKESEVLQARLDGIQNSITKYHKMFSKLTENGFPTVSTPPPSVNDSPATGDSNKSQHARRLDAMDVDDVLFTSTSTATSSVSHEKEEQKLGKENESKKQKTSHRPLLRKNQQPVEKHFIDMQHEMMEDDDDVEDIKKTTTVNSSEPKKKSKTVGADSKTFSKKRQASEISTAKVKQKVTKTITTAESESDSGSSSDSDSEKMSFGSKTMSTNDSKTNRKKGTEDDHQPPQKRPKSVKSEEEHGSSSSESDEDEDEDQRDKSSKSFSKVSPKRKNPAVEKKMRKHKSSIPKDSEKRRSVSPFSNDSPVAKATTTKAVTQSKDHEGGLSVSSSSESDASDIDDTYQKLLKKSSTPVSVSKQKPTVPTKRTIKEEKDLGTISSMSESSSDDDDDDDDDEEMSFHNVISS